MSKENGIVCRFAPSPTGLLHVGGARSALFNYLYARKLGGKLILRIEDTDRERSKKEYEDDIIESFRWLGLDFDETHRQSERANVHRTELEKLIKNGAAYVATEPAADGKRAEVIRFKNPRKRVAFEDLIKGKIEFDTTELGDFVIAKSLDEPLFHFAVVVDDYLMGITHVIRGEDHIANTPRQILIQEALGAPRPIYGHIPLILAPDRSKLSKRKHGESVAVRYYRDQGYLPEALLNFLALLGWNPGDDRELFSLAELLKEFSLERVQHGGAIFDIEKLNWMNKQYLTKSPKESVMKIMKERLSLVGESATLAPWQQDRIAQALLERIHYFGEMPNLMQTEFSYLHSTPQYNPQSLVWKKNPNRDNAMKHILSIVNILEKLDPQADANAIKAAVMPYAEEHGRGDVLWPFRFALSGREASLDPFTLAAILGTKESVKRLTTALAALKQSS